MQAGGWGSTAGEFDLPVQTATPNVINHAALALTHVPGSGNAGAPATMNVNERYRIDNASEIYPKGYTADVYAPHQKDCQTHYFSMNAYWG